MNISTQIEQLKIYNEKVNQALESLSVKYKAKIQEALKNNNIEEVEGLIKEKESLSRQLSEVREQLKQKEEKALDSKKDKVNASLFDFSEEESIDSSETALKEENQKLLKELEESKNKLKQFKKSNLSAVDNILSSVVSIEKVVQKELKGL